MERTVDGYFCHYCSVYRRYVWTMLVLLHVVSSLSFAMAVFSEPQYHAAGPATTHLSVAHLPTGQPSKQPANRPSSQPSRMPSLQPNPSPSVQPSLQPRARPSSQPTQMPSPWSADATALNPPYFHISQTDPNQVFYSSSTYLDTFLVVPNFVDRRIGAQGPLYLNLSLVQTFYPVGRNSVVPPRLVPSLIPFSPDQYLPPQFVSAVLGTPGSYKLTASIVGPDTDSLLLPPAHRVFISKIVGGSQNIDNSGIAMAILDASKPPALPNLLSAAFTPDGQYVDVLFSAPTNQASTRTSYFPCKNLFYTRFKRVVGSAICLWVDLQHVRIVPVGSNLASVQVGDELTLRNNLITAYCDPHVTAAISCSKWAKMPSQNVTVTIPTSPNIPLVVASISPAVAVVWPCQALNITFDLSASTDHGGRVWSRVMVAVSASVYVANTSSRASAPPDHVYLVAAASRLATTLQTKLTGIIPTASVPSLFLLVPSSPSFSGVVTYNIQFTLCNFLDICGSTNHTLSVASGASASKNAEASDAVVGILGSPVVSIYPGQPLTLLSMVQISPCRLQAQTSTSLFPVSCIPGSVQPFSPSAYRWSVLPPTGRGFNISSSRDLRLPPHTLIPGLTYTVSLHVEVLPSTVMSSAPVKVVMNSAPPIAQIAGGSDRVIAAGQHIMLDASFSLTSLASLSIPRSRVYFNWTCQQTNPVLMQLGQCPFTLTLLAPHIAQLQVEAGYSSNISVAARVILVVWDTQTRLSSRTVVQTTLINTLAAQIAIASTSYGAGLEKVPISQDITVLASVSALPTAPYPYKCQWLASSLPSQVNLSVIALSPTSRLVTPSFLTSFNLIIAGNTLPPATPLTFTLSCSQQSSSGSGILTTISSSIHMVTNDAPVPGDFSVNPASGYALWDVFTWTALRWKDPSGDLPLTYQFALFDSKPNALNTASGTASLPYVLQHRSDAYQLTTTLPASFAMTPLVCQLQVFDVYSAVMTTNNSNAITVRLLKNATQTHSLSSRAVSLLSLLADNRSDSHSSSQLHAPFSPTALTSVMAYTLNSAQSRCMLAPNCAFLNRYPCWDLDDTCGRCLPGYYYDFNQPGNLPCINNATTRMRFLHSPHVLSPSLCQSPIDCVPSPADRSNSRIDPAAWYVCNQTIVVAGVYGVCELIAKPCPGSDCHVRLGHGICRYVNTDTGTLLPDNGCRIGDEHCASYCECAADFSGPSCGIPTAQLLQRTEWRYHFLRVPPTFTTNGIRTSHAYLDQGGWSARVALLSALAGVVSYDLASSPCALMAAKLALMDALDFAVALVDVNENYVMHTAPYLTVPSLWLANLLLVADNLATAIAAVISTSSQQTIPMDGYQNCTVDTAFSHINQDGYAYMVTVLDRIIQLTSAHKSTVVIDGQPPLALQMQSLRMAAMFTTLRVSPTNATGLDPIAPHFRKLSMPQPDIENILGGTNTVDIQISAISDVSEGRNADMDAKYAYLTAVVFSLPRSLLPPANPPILARPLKWSIMVTPLLNTSSSSRSNSGIIMEVDVETNTITDETYGIVPGSNATLDTVCSGIDPTTPYMQMCPVSNTNISQVCDTVGVYLTVCPEVTRQPLCVSIGETNVNTSVYGRSVNFDASRSHCRYSFTSSSSDHAVSVSSYMLLATNLSTVTLPLITTVTSPPREIPFESALGSKYNLTLPLFVLAVCVVYFMPWLLFELQPKFSFRAAIKDIVGFIAPVSQPVEILLKTSRFHVMEGIILGQLKGQSALEDLQGMIKDYLNCVWHTSSSFRQGWSRWERFLLAMKQHHRTARLFFFDYLTEYTDTRDTAAAVAAGLEEKDGEKAANNPFNKNNLKHKGKEKRVTNKESPFPSEESAQLLKPNHTGSSSDVFTVELALDESSSMLRPSDVAGSPELSTEELHEERLRYLSKRRQRPANRYKSHVMLALDLSLSFSLQLSLLVITYTSLQSAQSGLGCAQHSTQEECLDSMNSLRVGDPYCMWEVPANGKISLAQTNADYTNNFYCQPNPHVNYLLLVACVLLIGMASWIWRPIVTSCLICLWAPALPTRRPQVIIDQLDANDPSNPSNVDAEWVISRDVPAYCKARREELLFVLSKHRLLLMDGHFRQTLMTAGKEGKFHLNQLLDDLHNHRESLDSDAERRAFDYLWLNAAKRVAVVSLEEEKPHAEAVWDAAQASVATDSGPVSASGARAPLIRAETRRRGASRTDQHQPQNIGGGGGSGGNFMQRLYARDVYKRWLRITGLIDIDLEAARVETARLSRTLPWHLHAAAAKEEDEDEGASDSDGDNQKEEASEGTIGFELLVQYMCDLLGRGTAASLVYQEKAHYDVPQGYYATASAQAMSAALLGFATVTCGYGLVVRSVVENAEFQELVVLLGCLLLVVDFCVDALAVVWFNLVLPEAVGPAVWTAMDTMERTVCKELQRIYHIKTKLIPECRVAQTRDTRLGNLAGARAHQQSLLGHFKSIALTSPAPLVDASQYFYVSKRLAAIKPTVMEAHMVLSHRSSRPPPTCERRWSERIAGDKAVEKAAMGSSPMGRVLVVCMGWLTSLLARCRPKQQRRADLILKSQRALSSKNFRRASFDQQSFVDQQSFLSSDDRDGDTSLSPDNAIGIGNGIGTARGGRLSGRVSMMTQSASGSFAALARRTRVTMMGGNDAAGDASDVGRSSNVSSLTNDNSSKLNTGVHTAIANDTNKQNATTTVGSEADGGTKQNAPNRTYSELVNHFESTEASDTQSRVLSKEEERQLNIRHRQSLSGFIESLRVWPAIVRWVLATFETWGSASFAVQTAILGLLNPLLTAVTMLLVSLSYSGSPLALFGVGLLVVIAVILVIRYLDDTPDEYLEYNLRKKEARLERQQRLEKSRLARKEASKAAKEARKQRRSQTNKSAMATDRDKDKDQGGETRGDGEICYDSPSSSDDANEYDTSGYNYYNDVNQDSNMSGVQQPKQEQGDDINVKEAKNGKQLSDKLTHRPSSGSVDNHKESSTLPGTGPVSGATNSPDSAHNTEQQPQPKAQSESQPTTQIRQAFEEYSRNETTERGLVDQELLKKLGLADPASSDSDSFNLEDLMALPPMDPAVFEELGTAPEYAEYATSARSESIAKWLDEIHQITSSRPATANDRPVQVGNAMTVIPRDEWDLDLKLMIDPDVKRQLPFYDDSGVDDLLGELDPLGDIEMLTVEKGNHDLVLKPSFDQQTKQHMPQHPPSQQRVVTNRGLFASEQRVATPVAQSIAVPTAAKSAESPAISYFMDELHYDGDY